MTHMINNFKLKKQQYYQNYQLKYCQPILAIRLSTTTTYSERFL